MERITGQPMADLGMLFLHGKVRKHILSEHPGLIHADTLILGCDESNWQECLSRVEKVFGTTLDVSVMKPEECLPPVDE